ncbi:hypothetical protein, partial [Frankia casuarinae]
MPDVTQYDDTPYADGPATAADGPATTATTATISPASSHARSGAPRQGSAAAVGRNGARRLPAAAIPRFADRHIGPDPSSQREMLDALRVESLAALTDAAVP